MGDFWSNRITRSFEMTLVLTWLVFAVPVSAADISANASRDAGRLVDCMRAFDATCANSLTYTKVLEQHGVSRQQLDEGVANLYRLMTSTHATAMDGR
jgi:hypothetical protein